MYRVLIENKSLLDGRYKYTLDSGFDDVLLDPHLIEPHAFLGREVAHWKRKEIRLERLITTSLKIIIVSRKFFIYIRR